MVQTSRQFRRVRDWADAFRLAALFEVFLQQTQSRP